MKSIERAVTADPHCLKLLQSHPEVGETALNPAVSGIGFWQAGRERRVCFGDPSCPLAGLVELIDNNPLVCADVVGVPDEASTLALIALGPLIAAGLLESEPAVLSNSSTDLVDPFLKRLSWEHGILCDDEEPDLDLDPQLGNVVAVNVVAAIATLDDWEELDTLYDEHFSRSFYVRRMEGPTWDTELVAGSPYAGYRLRITPDTGTSLLTIRTMGDRNGKCGAAQWVHAMNVMAGLEECLGIPERF